MPRSSGPVAAKKTGRPRRQPHVSAIAVAVKVTSSEHIQWLAAADREGLSLSAWLRAAAELAIARGSTR
jgi:hypothetical protein